VARAVRAAQAVSPQVAQAAQVARAVRAAQAAQVAQVERAAQVVVLVLHIYTEDRPAVLALALDLVHRYILDKTTSAHGGQAGLACMARFVEDHTCRDMLLVSVPAPVGTCDTPVVDNQMDPNASFQNYEVIHVMDNLIRRRTLGYTLGYIGISN